MKDFCVWVRGVIGFIFNRQPEFSALGSECYPRIYSKLVLSWQVTVDVVIQTLIRPSMKQLCSYAQGKKKTDYVD